MYAEKNNINFKGFSPEAIHEMSHYDWPGNVRELRNFVETAIILNKGEVVRSDYVKSSLNSEQPAFSNKETLPVPLNKTPEQAERELIYRTLVALKLDMSEMKQMLSSVLQGNYPYKALDKPHPFDESGEIGESENEVKPTTLSGMEREMIKETLNKYAGSRRKAARALQISERTLYRKIKEYGL